MKIAIDCRYILDPTNGQFGVISEYIDGLARALFDLKTNVEFVLFFSDKYTGDLAVEKPRVRVIRVPSKKGNFFFNHFSFPKIVAGHKPDIFFSPHGQLPLGYRSRAIITVHDLAIYDHPEWFPGGFSRWFSTKIVVPRSLCQAEKIIAVSEATKKDIIRLFGIDKGKIFVIYPAVNVPAVNKIINEEIRQKFSLPEKYFLCLGTIEPRKNLSLAIRATKILSDQSVDIHLVIAGKRGWKWQTTIEEIDKANQDKKIVSEFGYVSLEEKFVLLAGATALVFPSSYEGFGLPPLEAMKIGIPVITTAVGSLSEVCGRVARYVSVDDPQELARAMLEISCPQNSGDPTSLGLEGYGHRYSTDLVEQGFEQVVKFSWDKTAGAIIKILSEK